MSACGCCTGTIGACTEGCCCAACNPAPGGRTRDAREEIARVMRETADQPGYWLQFAPARWAILADAVLAVPAVADALALRERVEALAERAEREADEWAHPDAIGVVTADALRRALDNPNAEEAS